MFAAGDNTNGVVTAANQLYDPATGNPDGSGKTAFQGNVIPAGRINPIIAKQIIPYILADDQPNTGGTGAIQNNLFANQSNAYNLHKIDTKVDYIATSKLRVLGRFSKQPYKSVLNPIFGIPLGGTSNNWPAFQGTGNGNYYEHGAILAISGSATYVFSPSLVVRCHVWGDGRTPMSDSLRSDHGLGRSARHSWNRPVHTEILRWRLS